MRSPRRSRSAPTSSLAAICPRRPTSCRRPRRSLRVKLRRRPIQHFLLAGVRRHRTRRPAPPRRVQRPERSLERVPTRVRDLPRVALATPGPPVQGLTIRTPARGQTPRGPGQTPPGRDRPVRTTRTPGLVPIRPTQDRDPIAPVPGLPDPAATTNPSFGGRRTLAPSLGDVRVRRSSDVSRTCASLAPNRARSSPAPS